MGPGWIGGFSPAAPNTSPSRQPAPMAASSSAASSSKANLAALVTPLEAEEPKANGKGKAVAQVNPEWLGSEFKFCEDPANRLLVASHGSCMNVFI
jgi:hypothetical protein